MLKKAWRKLFSSKKIRVCRKNGTLTPYMDKSVAEKYVRIFGGTIKEDTKKR